MNETLKGLNAKAGLLMGGTATKKRTSRKKKKTLNKKTKRFKGGNGYTTLFNSKVSHYSI
jgi:hypothetical protein